MSNPDDERPSFVPPDGRPPASQQPPPHGWLYGQPASAPPAQGPPGPAAQASYDARWGYGPPGVPAQPRTHAVGDDTTWALLCYVGTIFVGLPAPLIIYLVKKRESAFIRHHAAQSMNYGFTVLTQILIALAVSIPFMIAAESQLPLLVIFVPVLAFHVVAAYVFLILGSVRSSKGEMYRFPTWTCWRMVR